MSPNHNRSMCRWLPLVAVVLLLCTTVQAAEGTGGKAAAVKLSVEKWLLLGPVPAPLPAFNDEGEAKVGPADLLEYEHVPVRALTPEAGASVALLGKSSGAWVTASADTGGALIPAVGKLAAVAYLATYVEVPRWMKADIDLRATQPAELFVDGSSLIKQKTPQKANTEGAKKTGTAKLGEGKHLLVVKTVCIPGDTLGEWRIGVSLSPASGFESSPVLSLDPARGLTVGDVLEAPAVSAIRVSPDGEYVAVAMSERTPPEGKTEKRTEIRKVGNAKLVTTLRDMADASNWHWAPVGHVLSYVVTKDEAGTIRTLDITTGENQTIVRDVKNLSDYAWSRDGSFIIYSCSQKPDKDETGVHRLRSIADRRDDERDKTYLFASTVPTGMTRRITAGEYSTALYDIHPDGRSVLIGRTYEELSARPYSVTELVRVSLEDGSTETLCKGHWIGSAVWAPDGKKILITAAPSTFGSAGLDVPEGTIPNDYDTEAYLFDPATKTAEPLTKDFDPTVLTAFWPAGGASGASGADIYLVVEETEYVRLYRYNVKAKTFKRIEIDCDVVHDSDVAAKKGSIVLYGSSANVPARLFAVDSKANKGRLFFDPAADRYSHVKLGKVEDWKFTASDGREIAGHIHYPRDFDPTKKWPCIVYYYGGTSPVDRSFGGRYPKDLWAAHGYVVYILQPSGATGFGQSFSAFHVNDWGKIVSEEIIEGTQKFLDAHAFIDPHRVGCIGASFGGFMTELLVTRTDIFAAAVSHAGISSITSYWGGGYWGYDYNAVSAANSFPWNRPDIYVGQSPLFAADKVNTPLLLLHGTADTNVPPGESEQMYTALKLLGKEVEYLRVEGQNHFVLDYKKRIVWSDAILAWFDKWLKDEPEWWADMYPPIAEAGKKKPSEMGLRQATHEKYGLVLFGKVTRDDVEREIEGWGGTEYDTYTPDSAALEALRERLEGTEITCVFGTWCGDSKREVPRLWKILDEAEYPASDLTLYAVGSSRFTKEMKIPQELLDWSRDVKAWHDVTAVPTIIVTRRGRELGRIIEQPETTLEADLLKMLDR